MKRPDAIIKLKEAITHLKEMEKSVDDQIKTQSIESSRSSESVSKASASASASAPSSSADPMDELEEEEPSTSAPAEPEISEVPTVYTDSDLEKIKELTSKAQTWLTENEAKQKKLKETDDPAFTLKDIEAEKKLLDDLIMDMMVKKMKYIKPEKPKAKPKAKPIKKKADKKPKKDKMEEEKPEKQNEKKESIFEDKEDLKIALRKAGVDINPDDDLSEAQIADAIRKLAGTGQRHNEL